MLIHPKTFPPGQCHNLKDSHIVQRMEIYRSISPSSALMPKLYVFVGRGHDPADQVAMIEWLVEWYRVPSDCKS